MLAALVEAGNYLNDRLRGRTIREARDEILKEVEQQQAKLDRLAANVVEAGLADWAGSDNTPSRLIIRGRSRLLDDITAIEDLERLRLLFNDLEAKGDLLNILDLEEVSVDDVMVPRNDVYGIDLDDSDDDILRCIQSSNHTRLPVWRDDINNIVGVLHMRNISRIIDRQGLDRDALEREMDKPYFIPESTPLHTQLLHFQKNKLRLAIVVDEYGEVMGIVALEDILEEIVGEFTSRMSDGSDAIFAQRDGSYIIAGNANLRDVNKALNWELPTDGPKTLSGLLLEYLESFPDGNVGLAIAGYRLEILELQGNVVQAVRASPARVKGKGWL